MNKTKIDWCDMTWNPVTGCLHNCPYCYARKIADRFGGSIETAPDGLLHELDEQFIADRSGQEKGSRICPYPYVFDPTFHKYRLGDPAGIKKPQNIFVCSMADLFGEWVPEEWTYEVFKACNSAPQHTYLFLTKNPRRYADDWINDEIINFGLQKHCYFGVSVCNQEMVNDAIFCIGNTRSSINTFLSIEPIQEQIVLPRPAWIEWVIIGAETGNRKEKVIPKREWIEEIAVECKKANIPIFMKESLRDIMGKDFVQEFPVDMKTGLPEVPNEL